MINKEKCLTWSVWRVVEFVINTSFHRPFLEVSHLVHVLQVQNKRNCYGGHSSCTQKWPQAIIHVNISDQKVTILVTHNPEGIVFDLSGEELIFLNPPLDAAFTGVVRKDGLTWPHLSATGDKTWGMVASWSRRWCFHKPSDSNTGPFY